MILAAVVVIGLAGCADHTQHATEPIDSGHPTHSAAPPTTPLTAGPREQIISVGVPADFTPQAPSGATDEYRCFIAEPDLRDDVYITGTQVLPGNAAIVHHAILYAAYPEQVAAARALDAEDAQPGYECFGGSQLPPRGDAVSALDSSDWLAAWAPGGKASQAPPGYGTQLPQGSAVVIQMHYNLAQAQGSDSTQVQLRVTEQQRKPLRTTLLPGPVELPCEPGETGRLCDRAMALDDVVSRFGGGAGATIAGLQMLCGGDPEAPRAGAVQTCDRRVPEAARIFAVAGHMHLLGREISITLNPGRQSEQVLLDIDNWDFDQQAAIPLPEPVEVRAGDTLRVRCRHDAGLRSQLPALQGQDPRYVLWGEGTADEMCLGIVISG